jgi:hypothetical protein
MNADPTSAVSLAHLRLSVTQLSGAVAFFEAIGARTDVQREYFAVIELRDHTRLQLTQSENTLPGGTALQFDFKVEDLDAAWRDYRAKGLNPSEIIRRNPGHDSFVLAGPDSCEVQVNSGFKGS